MRMTIGMFSIAVLNSIVFLQRWGTDCTVLQSDRFAHIQYVIAFDDFWKKLLLSEVTGLTLLDSMTHSG